MGHRKKHAPRHGSLAYLPRKRASISKGRVRHWRKDSNKMQFVGFAGFKAGMSHITFIEDQNNSPYFGKELMKPVTIIEVPPLLLIGIRIKSVDEYGVFTKGEVFTDNLNEFTSRKILLPNTENYQQKSRLNKLKENLDDRCEIFGIFQTQPYLISPPRKVPDIIEIPFDDLGSVKEGFKAVVDLLGKELRVRDVFDEGELIDVISVSKGKGFQGPVKRFGVKILTRKNSKIRRAVACIGPWHPARVLYTVPRPGQLGYHQRTEYRKRIMKISENEEEINPKGGIINYGVIKSEFLLVLGSIPGSKKRLIRLRKTLRPQKSFEIRVPEITFISKESHQRK